jgi:hypothetical protein
MVVGVYCGQRSERALVRILPYMGMVPRGRGECPGARGAELCLSSSVPSALPPSPVYNTPRTCLET